MSDAFALSFSLAQIVDGVILLTLVEIALLIGWHRVTGAGVAPREFAANLVSGLCLMLALHCAVREVGEYWVAACLAAAGIAHVTDLGRRWVRRTRSRPVASDAATGRPPPRKPAG